MPEDVPLYKNLPEDEKDEKLPKDEKSPKDEENEKNEKSPKKCMNWIQAKSEYRTDLIYETVREIIDEEWGKMKCEWGKKIYSELKPEEKEHAKKKLIMDYVWRNHTKQNQKEYRGLEEDEEKKRNGWMHAHDAAKKLVDSFKKSLAHIPIWKEFDASILKSEIEYRMYPRDDNEEEARSKSLSQIPLKQHQRYTYDYAVVFRLLKKPDMEDKEEQEKCDQELMQIIEILDCLSYGGVETFIYKSEYDEEKENGMLVCLLGCTESRLRLEAERIEYDVELDYNQIFEQGKVNDPPFLLCKEIDHQIENEKRRDAEGNPCCSCGASSRKFSRRIFQKTFGQFKDFRPKDSEGEKNPLGKKRLLYLRYNDTPFRKRSFFSELARLKITQYVIEADMQFGGCQLKLAYYARTKAHPAIGFFALHEPTDRKRVKDKFHEDGALLKDMCLCSRDITPDPEEEGSAEPEEKQDIPEGEKKESDEGDAQGKSSEKKESDEGDAQGKSSEKKELDEGDAQGESSEKKESDEDAESDIEIEEGQPKIVDYDKDEFFYENNPSLPKCCGISHSKMHWEIRNYFGENVALYFSFLSFYSACLIPTAIIGVIVFAPQMLAGNKLTVLNYLFGAVMIIWSTVFLEMWKRETAKLRAYWGMSNFKSKESVRPEFEGNLKINFVTGEVEEQVEPFWLTIWRTLSWTAIIVFLSIVIAIVAGLLLFKIELLRSGSKSIPAVLLPPFLNALAINLLNVLYGLCSGKLTDLEKHKTESSYENSKITKSFIFKMINSYNSLLIIAFLKGKLATLGYCAGSYRLQWMTLPLEPPSGYNVTTYLIWRDGLDPGEGAIPGEPPFNKLSNLEAELGGNVPDAPCKKWDYWKTCGEKTLCDQMCTIYDSMKTLGYDNTGNCFQELMIQLTILFGTQIVLGNFIEVVLPVLIPKIKACVSKEEKPEYGSVAEEEFSHAQYAGTFGDYDELLVQFGYVSLFVVAFPLAPLLALFSNLLEFLVDGTKLMTLSRRPYPLGAYDMGAWYNMLQVLAFIGIMTNIGLLTLNESPILGKKIFYADYSASRIAIFLAIEHFCILVKVGIMNLIPDEPGKIFEHTQREEYTTDILIGR